MSEQKYADRRILLCVVALFAATAVHAATKDAATKDAATRITASKNAATKNPAAKNAVIKHAVIKNAVIKNAVTKNTATKNAATKTAAAKKGAKNAGVKNSPLRPLLWQSVSRGSPADGKATRQGWKSKSNRARLGGRFGFPPTVRRALPSRRKPAAQSKPPVGNGRQP